MSEWKPVVEPEPITIEALQRDGWEKYAGAFWCYDIIEANILYLAADEDGAIHLCVADLGEIALSNVKTMADLRMLVLLLTDEKMQE